MADDRKGRIREGDDFAEKQEIGCRKQNKRDQTLPSGFSNPMPGMIGLARMLIRFLKAGCSRFNRSSSLKKFRLNSLAAVHVP
jgi:hypothetical protein